MKYLNDLTVRAIPYLSAGTFLLGFLLMGVGRATDNWFRATLGVALIMLARFIDLERRLVSIEAKIDATPLTVLQIRKTDVDEREIQ